MYKPLPDPVAGGEGVRRGGSPAGGGGTNFGGGEAIEIWPENLENPWEN